jgi:exopolyphosphatase/guanosine-5'-triphosphate,3'-diphosphate pyrophosphatase
MILAGIDIGTNTLRLLVAETGPDSFQELYSDRRITRLGQDLDRTGLISEEAGDRSIAALIDFKKNIQRHSTFQTSAVGTSALRNASNSAQFIAAVKQRTGLELTVISGEEEARLALLGVAQALKEPGYPGKNDPLESAFVIDIGGGSTEIILTRKGVAPVIMSLPLGAVYLTERFIKNDPPSPAEKELLHRAIRNELENCSAVLRPDRASILVGTAGTVTALAAIDLGLATYDPLKINRHGMARDSVDRIVRELGQRTLSERIDMAGLDHGREDIILAGAMIVQEIMERYGYGNILVSDWGLREGIVMDLYEKVVKENATALSAG